MANHARDPLPLSSDERLRRLLETSNDLTWTISVDGRVLELGRQAWASIGYEADEVTERGFLEFIHPDSHEQLIGDVARIAAEGISIRGREAMYVHRDGCPIEVVINAVPVFDDDGRVVAITGCTTDVSRERAAERRLRESEERYRHLVETSHDLIWSMDGEGRMTYVNGAARTLLGAHRTQMDGTQFLEFVAPHAREALAEDFRALLRDGSASGVQSVLHDRHANEVHVLINAVVHRAPDGELLQIVGTTTDITALKQAQAEAEVAREQFSGAFAHAPTGMCIVELDPDRGPKLIKVNRALEAICAMPAESLVGRYAHDAGAERVWGELGLVRQLIAGDIDTYTIEKRFRRPDGEFRWIQVHSSAVRSAAGTQPIAVNQVQDVTERREMEERLRHLADHDPLTDLLNRRRFDDELRRQLSMAQRYDESGAVVVLDLDNFKDANDTFGHHAGDAVIRVVAQRLRRRLRDTDILARLGGDEFAVILPRADEESVRSVARDLLATIREEQVEIGDGQVLHLTASMGIALFRRTDLSHDDLLALADVAMYQAKDRGRDAFAVYDADDGHKEVMARRLSLVHLLRAALDGSDGFELHVQPILALASGRFDHQEVLLRLRGPDGELISPGEFLPVAERFGLMPAIDRWVADEAMRLMRAQQDAGIDVVTEVNLAPQSLGDADFPAYIEERVRARGADPRRLVFEVTETAAIANMADARAFIDRVGALGCLFALDDFGAGYGSFRYLKQMHFDYLKVDGDFIRDLPRSHDDQVMVKAVVDAAVGLGKKVVAEFVSDDETIALLREWGVDYAQGFHIGVPGPVALLAR